MQFLLITLILSGCVAFGNCLQHNRHLESAGILYQIDTPATGKWGYIDDEQDNLIPMDSQTYEKLRFRHRPVNHYLPGLEGSITEWEYSVMMDSIKEIKKGKPFPHFLYNLTLDPDHNYVAGGDLHGLNFSMRKLLVDSINDRKIMMLILNADVREFTIAPNTIEKCRQWPKCYNNDYSGKSLKDLIRERLLTLEK